MTSPPPPLTKFAFLARDRTLRIHGNETPRKAPRLPKIILDVNFLAPHIVCAERPRPIIVACLWCIHSSAIAPQMSYVECEPVRAGIQAERHARIVARLIDWRAVDGEDISGGIVVAASGVEALRIDSRGVQNVE